MLNWIIAAIFLLLPLSISAANPGLVILSPTNDQILPGHQLTAQFLTPNFTPPKQGHLHLWLDQTQFTPTSAIKVYSTSHLLTNLKYGPHTLTAELVKPDHSPFSPPVTASATFKLDPPAMSPAPADSSSLFLILTIFIILTAAFYLIPVSKKH